VEVSIMAMQATCSNCGTRLSYNGTAAAATRPCPKCQQPVNFGTAGPAWPPQKPAAAQPTEVVAELIEPPAKPTMPAPIPAKSSSGVWWVLIPVGVLGGGMLMLLILCAGVGAFMMSKSESSTVVSDSKGAYDPVYMPASATYSEPSYSTPSYSTPTYSEPSYTTPTYTAPAPTYTPPAESYSTAPSDPGLFNFNLDRASELEGLIARERQKLTEINIALGLVAGGRAAGGKALESESALDQLIGLGAEAFAEASRAELETEKSLIQGRISAYQQELAGLPR
jgi:hypothetical protein